MANIEKAFSSDYLKAADFDSPVKFTIRTVEFGVKIGDDTKPVLYFSGEKKGLVLNRTNSKIITNAYGKETDDWIGKEIIIYPTEVEFKGDIVDAIRVRIGKSEMRQEFKKPAEPDFDEEGYPIR